MSLKSILILIKTLKENVGLLGQSLFVGLMNNLSFQMMLQCPSVIQQGIAGLSATSF